MSRAITTKTKSSYPSTSRPRGRGRGQNQRASSSYSPYVMNRPGEQASALQYSEDEDRRQDCLGRGGGAEDRTLQR